MNRRPPNRPFSDFVPSTSPPEARSGNAGEIDALRLLRELQVHQVELAQQNEALEAARADLQASAQRYFDLYESAPVGLLSLDAAGIVRDANGSSRQLMADDNLVGKRLVDILADDGGRELARVLTQAPAEPSIRPGGRDHAGGERDARLARRDLPSACRRHRRPAGRHRHHRAAPLRGRSRTHARDPRTVQPPRPHRVLAVRPRHGRLDLVARRAGDLRTAGRHARRLYGTIRDIDARVQAAAARLAQAEAEMANRSKNAFLARMSHDLRTPLNAVLGFSELLEHDAAAMPVQGVAEQARHIHEAGQHLLAMVDEVLDLTRIESGDLHIAMAPVDLASLLDDCLKLVAPLAAARRVKLQSPRTTPCQCALGDRTRLRQVVMNLLSNAVKYNREGGSVEIDVRSEADRVVVAVRDTGPGLSLEQLGHLFEPFNRLGMERSTIEGTGLGLVITRQLITAMARTIDVRSDPGTGSVFSLNLPRAPVRDTADRTPAGGAIGVSAGPFHESARRSMQGSTATSSSPWCSRACCCWIRPWPPPDESGVCTPGPIAAPPSAQAQAGIAPRA